MDAAQKQRLIDAFDPVINAQRRELLKNILAQRTRYITVVLEDIYQPQNTSAVIRSAECLGLQEIHVIENKHEYQLNRAVVKGASKWIEINRYRKKDRCNTTSCLSSLRDRGYRIIAMTLREQGRNLEELEINTPLALCFGSEEPGLSDTAHQMADEYIKIPMLGFTRSFNLSVSAGISLHYLTSCLRRSSRAWQLAEEDLTNLYIEWLSKSTPTGKVLLEKFISNDDQE